MSLSRAAFLDQLGSAISSMSFEYQVALELPLTPPCLRDDFLIVGDIVKHDNIASLTLVMSIMDGLPDLLNLCIGLFYLGDRNAFQTTADGMVISHAIYKSVTLRAKGSTIWLASIPIQPGRFCPVLFEPLDGHQDLKPSAHGFSPGFFMSN